MKKIISLIFLLFSIVSVVKAQYYYGINAPHPNAIATYQSFDSAQGIKIPFVKTAKRPLASTSQGILIYNVEDSCFQVSDGAIWYCLGEVGEDSVYNEWSDGDTISLSGLIYAKQAMLNGDTIMFTDNGDFLIGSSSPLNTIAVAGLKYNHADNSLAIGSRTLADGSRSVSFGEGDTVLANYSSILGGKNNKTNVKYSVIGNGEYNRLNGGGAYTGLVIGGGDSNYINQARYSVIGGGLSNNNFNSDYSVLSGGRSNRINSSDYGFLGGGQDVFNYGFAAVSVGGDSTINNYNDYSFMGGGQTNLMNNRCAYSIIVGGKSNSIFSIGQYSIIVGGENNSNQSGDYFFMGGGYGNQTVNSDYSLIVGGQSNSVNSGSSNSSIVGGFENSLTSDYSVIVGGDSNVVLGNYGVIAGGQENIIQSGEQYSFIGGGYQNIVNGDSVVALGVRNDINHTGSFGLGAGASSSTEQEMNMKFIGGYRLFSDAAETSGVTLASGGGAWVAVSDKNKKENSLELDKREILDKVVSLEVENWNYKSQSDSIRHIGPYAQDFYKEFGLGSDSLGIVTSDISGVNMVAIQGLFEYIKELEKENQILKSQKASKEDLDALKSEIDAIKLMMSKASAE